ncbi:putative hydrolase [Saccharomycopsis crataegensis]|uniref:Hydrolase n=1 Tax=Saccharomycopsis crataegensis TaxID=43959 RepID=A0AAV5QHZ6_9ASCO|nr:putative hydrolase [Saccharomycopsis crataegensis]
MTISAYPKNIRACLFDMDGTLINSEDVYTETISEALAEYGAGPLTWDLKIKLQGLPGLVSTKLVLEHYKIADKTTPESFFKRTTELQYSKFPNCNFLQGVPELLTHLKSNKVPMAVATSSIKETFDLKTSKLKPNGFDLFDVIITGDNAEIPKGRGKPNPDIYLLTLKKLNEKLGYHGTDEEIQPHECLVFEDGVPGVLSGINAGSYVIWIADKRALKVLNGQEDEIINSKGELIDSFETFDITKFGI